MKYVVALLITVASSGIVVLCLFLYLRETSAPKAVEFPRQHEIIPARDPKVSFLAVGDIMLSRNASSRTTTHCYPSAA